MNAQDQHRWNQIFFENANKNHLHQDNLRWTLSGGFAAFFYGSIVLLSNDKISANATLVHQLHILFFTLGTLYWIAVSVEGWYYNLYLKYLVRCEHDLVANVDLLPLISFDRKTVSLFHPSFSPILLLIGCANAFHLYSVSSQWGWCVGYLLVCVSYAFWGRMFRPLDQTRASKLTEGSLSKQ